MTPDDQDEVRRRLRSIPHLRFSVLYLFAIFGALVADKWLGA